MQHAVIMAGGAGTRLWPLSRKRRPKQLLRLFDGTSLLQLAVRRLRGLFPAERTWLITAADQLEQAAADVPEIPRANLVGEPQGRDTANAIGLAALLLQQRDPDATMAVFTADHIISPAERFRAAIQQGLAAAERFPQALVTFGVRPQAAHTGFGYLRRGEQLGPGTFRVAEFKEKPSAETAEAYLRSGQYYWNSGMFAWRTAAILDELRRSLPDNMRSLEALAADWSRAASTPETAAQYAELPRTSIDYGVMEKATTVLVVEMDCDWRDVGSWTAVAELQKPDDAGNVAVAAQTLVMDAHNNIVVSESPHLVVLAGVDDLIVVHSDDATLICRRGDAERIRELTARRQAQFGERFE